MKGWSYRFFTNGIEVTNLVKARFPPVREIDNQLEMLQRDFTLSVAEGLVERDAEGRISADARFSGATKGNREAMRILRIERMLFSTNDKFLSVSSDNPTAFESTKEFSIEKGTSVPPLLGPAVPAETDVNGDILITARMHKEEARIVGEYSSTCDLWIPIPKVGRMKMEYDFAGTFWLKLADG